ncbi:hypothetical protein [Shewanella baltica]|uniref:hypothetical protein n=1 Tax=Shewanella baltica TaxID=62322 RepID=UPI00217F0138|nr:hypothetical protein [Shewanella baltica]MCS6098690.1 hypothetical protein [Shewanella baltica]MCS6181876.1 hypothetical protein [Shewanella baltica]
MKTLTLLPIASRLLICSALTLGTAFTLGTALTLVIAPLGQAIAASSATDSAASPNIETITVTYRDPLDYALYQHTTEMLSVFRLEIREDIGIQARNSLMEMAKAQHVNRLNLAQLQASNKNLAFVRVSPSAKANR